LVASSGTITSGLSWLIHSFRNSYCASSLVEAHLNLDAAVFAAYGWPVTLTDAELLERLLALNHQRAAASQG
jgi:hypothetical protein